MTTSINGFNSIISGPYTQITSAITGKLLFIFSPGIADVFHNVRTAIKNYLSDLHSPHKFLTVYY